MTQFGPQASPTPSQDGSLYMRPFAIGMTAYLVTYCLLYMMTRGSFRSPDAVSDVYFFVLATYAGGPEIKRWTSGEHEDPEGLPERVRKGGPLVTLWFLLWAGAVLWRLHDPEVPMPPELKTILLQVMGLFFGTYALRQIRKRSVRQGLVRSDMAAGEGPQVDTDSQVVEFLTENGPSTPKTIREGLGLARSTLTRALTDLLQQRRVARDANSPRDPNPVYRLK